MGVRAKWMKRPSEKSQVIKTSREKYKRGCLPTGRVCVCVLVGCLSRVLEKLGSLTGKLGWFDAIFSPFE